jgi:hypothetical protein
MRQAPCPKRFLTTDSSCRSRISCTMRPMSELAGSRINGNFKRSTNQWYSKASQSQEHLTEAKLLRSCCTCQRGVVRGSRRLRNQLGKPTKYETMITPGGTWAFPYCVGHALTGGGGGMIREICPLCEDTDDICASSQFVLFGNQGRPLLRHLFQGRPDARLGQGAAPRGAADDGVNSLHRHRPCLDQNIAQIKL